MSALAGGGASLGDGETAVGVGTCVGVGITTGVAVGTGGGVGVTCGAAVLITEKYVVSAEPQYELQLSKVAVTWYVPSTGGVQDYAVFAVNVGCGGA